MRVDFTPDPTLYPFTSHWLDSSRGRMHYIDEGSGPPIMLCHGNPTWSFLYREIIAGTRTIAESCCCGGLLDRFINTIGCGFRCVFRCGGFREIGAPGTADWEIR